MPKRKQPGKDVRSRAWCFTLNNYTSEEVALLRVLSDGCKYLIFGYEVGEKGTPHLQGYLYFKDAKSFSATKKFLPKRAHLEKARGTPEENKEYCSKDGEFEERGDLPMSQKQKGEAEQLRWDEIKEAAKEGRLDDIDDRVYVTHYRTLKAIKTDHQRPPDSRPELIDEWIWGESGVGKSSYARKEIPNPYLKNLSKWWDGYQLGQSVIIDDMDVFHKDLGYLFKIWCDHYAFVAETKGGIMCIRPPKIIITSQYHPSEIWSDSKTLAAITRRVKITHMSEPLSASTPPPPSRLFSLSDIL